MNEYEITCRSGFRTKTIYLTAKSAEDIQAIIEEKLSFEIYEGLRYTIKKL